MAEKTRSRRGTQPASQNSPRSWVFSVFWGAAAVGATLAVSATVNPLFGRSVHWDWVAGIAPVAFVAIVLSFRRRWV